MALSSLERRSARPCVMGYRRCPGVEPVLGVRRASTLRWGSYDRSRAPALPALLQTRLASSGSGYLGPSASFRVLQRSRLSVDITARVLSHTPRRVVVCFGVMVPPIPHGPPSWFLPTLAACPARSFQACCILEPTFRFTGFPPSLRKTLDRSYVTGLSLRCCALQSIPLPSSGPGVSADSCLLVVRPGRSRTSTSRPCSTRESVASPHRVRRGVARGSPGLSLSGAARPSSRAAGPSPPRGFSDPPATVARRLRCGGWVPPRGVVGPHARVSCRPQRLAALRATRRPC